jgi:hypothetical protein
MSKISGQNTDFFGAPQANTPAGISNPYTKVLPDGTMDMTVGEELGAGAMGEEAAVGAGAAEGGAGMAGAAATMNPYLMAGALALQAYSANQKQQQEFAMRKQQGMEKAAYSGAQAFDRMRNLV